MLASSHSVLSFENNEIVPEIDISNEPKICKTTKPGEICEISGKTYFMKPASGKKHSTLLRDLFNKKLARDYIGVTVPKTLIFKKKDTKHGDRLFLASEKVNKFSSADDYHNPTILLNKLSNSERAKFAVANTFFYDLCSQNWGANDQGLVLIDLDSSPQTFLSYLHNAQMHRSTLSLINLKEMLAIYKKMILMPVPQINGNYYMEQSTYHEILHSFILSAQAAIDHIDQLTDLDPSQPNEIVNAAFKNEIEKTIRQGQCDVTSKLSLKQK